MRRGPDDEPDQVEAEPPSAAAVFGDRISLARGFVDHLATSGTERGLIGPRELPRLWTRHVLNCAALAELVPRDSRVIDVGSGAGLPGLALAIARPDVHVVLVEPMERRTTWLAEVVAALELDATVRRARAEELKGRERASVVTSRAVAPLEKLLRWCLPLVTPGGTVLAIKGSSATTELETVRPSLARRGIVTAEVVVCGTAVVEGGTTVVRVVRGGGPSPQSGVPGPA